MSYPEVLLWQRLRGAPMGIRFRRQHPIGSDYTADFYCAAAKLVIEVDGKVHDLAAAQVNDAVRDTYFRSQGLTVLRVLAADVLANADEIAASIVALAATPLHHSPLPSGSPPRTGEDQKS